MVCTTLNNIQRALTLVIATTGCIYISAFASLLDIPTRISISTTG